MQPEPHHAAPEEERNFSGFRILPSGAPVTDTPPFDRLFEEGAGNGLYALAVSNWETAPDPGAFFIKNMARQALTRMAHAAAERPDEVDTVLDHLPASTAERAALAEQFPPVPGAEYVTPGVIAGWLEDFRKLVKRRSEPAASPPPRGWTGWAHPGTRSGRYSSTLRKTGMTPRAPAPLPSWLPLRIKARRITRCATFPFPPP